MGLPYEAVEELEMGVGPVLARDVNPLHPRWPSENVVGAVEELQDVY